MSKTGERSRKSEGGSAKVESGSHAPASFLPTSDFALPPFRDLLLALLVAIGLTWLFWFPLWEGGSLIGGDLFPYFFPQKVFLAEQLKSGTVPLWNPLTGHGYPTIAESQTGVCYPPDLLAYRWLSVTPAYNAVQLAHYVFGFLGVWLLARKLGCGNSGALVAGLSFIYGWFAPRICLEWAIVTGAYLPWALWCAECYLQDRRLRHLVALGGLLTFQLLAGHFHLAFITQLTLAVYAPLRWRLSLHSPLEEEGPGVRGMSRAASVETAPAAVSAPSSGLRPPSPARGEGTKPAPFLMIWVTIVFAFLLSAVQLAPTWELKQRSQRSEVSREHQPGYGHLPPAYWSQAVAPWLWYAENIDPRLEKLPNFAGGAGTNRVEAHLYFGLLPLALAVVGIVAAVRGRTENDRVLRLWSLLGLAFLLYTPGWFLPVTQHLPGFSFFRGPGRYGIITSFAVALLAGSGFTRLIRRWPGSAKLAATLLVLGVTAGELWWVARQVGYSELLPVPLVERRVDSPVRRLLAQEAQPVRLFAPMANVANLLDVSSTPVYLGIGPAEYFDPRFTLPAGATSGLDPAGDAEQIRWLQQAGVTHVFSLERLHLKNWPAELQWTGVDPFLHAVFGRSGNEPVFLYRLRDARGRVAWEDAGADGSAQVTEYAPHRIHIRCESNAGGRLVLTDLAYPGWEVAVDGKPATVESSGMFRAVTVGPGTHDVVWSYRPASVYWGTRISVLTTIALAVLIGGLGMRRKTASTVALSSKA